MGTLIVANIVMMIMNKIMIMMTMSNMLKIIMKTRLLTGGKMEKLTQKSHNLLAGKILEVQKMRTIKLRYEYNN
jgi:hypothetical protein